LIVFRWDFVRNRNDTNARFTWVWWDALAGAAFMARMALGCFEQLSDGNWICQQGVKIDGRSCPVLVRRGQLFRQGSVFAGYDDFPAYLTKMSSARADKLPHEWAERAVTN
jgi:hypothetical protein